MSTPLFAATAPDAAPPTAGFVLGGRPLGPDQPPFIVAELSGNHGGLLERALALVAAAAHAGADAIKLQTYTAETMTLDHDGPGFVIDDPESLWHGERLFDLYRRAATPWEWHATLFARARDLGLLAFSTPFDASAVALLETLDVPCYKIASFENIDVPLIRAVAATGKPLLLSTGMASVAELDAAVQTARAAGARELLLLRCVSAYPAPVAASNLRALDTLRARYGCLVGLSDHSLGTTVAVAAVARGAVLIEKHVTLARDAAAVDGAFSLEPPELGRLVAETRSAWTALGDGTIGCGARERASLAHRRSLYVVADVAAGMPLTPANLRAIRPGLGLAPEHYDAVLGRCVTRDVPRGTPLSWDLLAPPPPARAHRPPG